MNKLKVGIDFDGVLVDTVTQYLYWFNKITGENIKPKQLQTVKDILKCLHIIVKLKCILLLFQILKI